MIESTTLNFKRNSAQYKFARQTENQNIGFSKLNDENQKERCFLMGPFEILNREQKADGTGSGFYVQFQNSFTHQPVQMHLLATEVRDTPKLLSLLIDRGLDFDVTLNTDQQRSLMSAFFFDPDNYKSDKLLVLHPSTGWNKEKTFFVTPNEVFGSADDGAQHIYFVDEENEQSTVKLDNKGSLSDWQVVSRDMERNCSLGVFALSCAFAAPCVQLCGARNMAFNINTVSSRGKSFLLDVAASVYSGVGTKNSYVCTWTATTNGLELLASAYNDLLLPMDELGASSKPEEMGRAIYMIAGGKGKVRSTKDAKLQKTNKWHTILLSTGELSLAQLVKSAGGDVYDGQEVRMLDLYFLDKGELTLFERLPEGENLHTYCMRLKTCMDKNHGVAFPEFMKKLISDPNARSDIEATVERLVLDWTIDCSAIVARGASSFAFVAAVGEKATEYGITGWNEGSAINAAEKMFSCWRSKAESDFQQNDFLKKHIRQVLIKQKDRFIDPSEEPTEATIGYVKEHKRLKENVFYFDEQSFDKYICTPCNRTVDDVWGFLKSINKALLDNGNKPQLNLADGSKPRMFAIKASI